VKLGILEEGCPQLEPIRRIEVTMSATDAFGIYCGGEMIRTTPSGNTNTLR
jgi:hypothetical protein